MENSNKEIIEVTGNEETQSAEESQSKTEDNESLWDKITGAVNDAKETVGDTIENVTTLGSAKIEELTKSAENTLNKFIEATAVMLITSCVIPILKSTICMATSSLPMSGMWWYFMCGFLKYLWELEVGMCLILLRNDEERRGKL